MVATKVLTIEEIDARVTANNARLEVINRELKTKNDALGSARGFQLPTVSMIHKAIDNLEYEKREIEAGQEFLAQEREHIQNATTQAEAEAAASEYNSMLDDLTPRATTIIKSLYAVQTQLLELENIQELMSEKAAVAGKLVINPAFAGAIIIQIDQAKANINQVLNQIVAFNSRELIEKAGIEIVDMHAERARISSRFSFGDSAVIGRAPIETGSKPEGMLYESARKAAGLPMR